MNGPELRLVQPLDPPGRDQLRSWAQRNSYRPTPPAPPLAGQLRFAFYGRVSTEDHQDPESSRAWQRTRADALIAGTGQIVVEFFDVGRSRVLPWAARPAAAALIAALADPDRGFDAIVVGEAERAFYGPQYEQMAPVFARYGVRAWVPDVGGPVDPEIGSLEELMALLGILSKREIVRARIRTMTSMTILTERQGRFLGWRAPFGYRLVPIKPHPNPTHARWGRMQLGLAPDPEIAGSGPRGSCTRSAGSTSWQIRPRLRI